MNDLRPNTPHSWADQETTERWDLETRLGTIPDELLLVMYALKTNSTDKKYMDSRPEEYFIDQEITRRKNPALNKDKYAAVPIEQLEILINLSPWIDKDFTTLDNHDLMKERAEILYRNPRLSPETLDLIFADEIEKRKAAGSKYDFEKERHREHWDYYYEGYDAEALEEEYDKLRVEINELDGILERSKDDANWQGRYDYYDPYNNVNNIEKANKFEYLSKRLNKPD